MSYALTEAIKNNSARGKALAKKFNINIDPLLKKDILSLEDVKEIYKFLNEAKKDYQPDKRFEGNSLSKGTLDFLINGGNSCLSFCRDILKKEGILKSYTRDISIEELNTEEDLKNLNLSVFKSTNDELQQATFVVMVPDEVDLHGDITSEAEVAKACHSFNKHSRVANLFHLVETDSFSIIESYIAPVEFVLGDKFVKKGTWLCTVQCHDDYLWSLIKSGKICSVSIGAMAKVEKIDNE